MIIGLKERVAERVYALLCDNLKDTAYEISNTPYADIEPELERLRDLTDAIDAFSYAMLDGKEGAHE